LKDFVRCPKCEKQFSLRDWLVIGATHVIFDCKGKPTSRQATLEETVGESIFVKMSEITVALPEQNEDGSRPSDSDRINEIVDGEEE